MEAALPPSPALFFRASPLALSERKPSRANIENNSPSPSPKVAAKQVRKRRKSVGPAAAKNANTFSMMDDDDEEDVDVSALRFDLDSALSDNETLTDQLMEARAALAASEAERGRLQRELNNLLRPKEPPTTVDARSSLGLSARICGIGPLAVGAPGKRAEPEPPAAAASPQDDNMESSSAEAPEEAAEANNDIKEDEEKKPLAQRRSRRKSVVSKESIAAAREEISTSSTATVSPPAAASKPAASKPPPPAVVEAWQPPAASPPAEAAWPTLAEGVLPSDAAVAAIADEGGMLATVLQMALTDAAEANDAGAETAAAWSAAREVLKRLGGVASSLRGKPLGGKQKRTVRFAVHDLSCLEPPKVQRPGSETEQERVIEQLAGLMRAQRALLLPASNVDAAKEEEEGADAAAAGGAAAASPAVRCLTHLLAAFGALARHSSLGADMRASASFYAHELAQMLSSGTPMLARRLSELLSSSLRLHLAAIFSEEEGTTEPDPNLAAMLGRVREHGAAFGFSVASGEDAAEHFAALVSAHLQTLHAHAPLLAAGTPAHAALTAAAAANGGDNDADASAALHELPAEDKANLLSWAQAHAVLLQVFGPQQPLQKLLKTPNNKAHVATLGELAALVGELELPDEAYLGPLADVPALQKRLHAEAALAKAAHEGLLLFAMGSKRRSARATPARRR